LGGSLVFSGIDSPSSQNVLILTGFVLDCYLEMIF
jgi:hypothetical protein